jgi:hypothetical protein
MTGESSEGFDDRAYRSAQDLDTKPPDLLTRPGVRRSRRSHPPGYSGVDQGVKSLFGQRVLASTPVKNLIVATALAALTLTACSSSDGDGGADNTVQTCTDAIQAIADSGADASTPPECDGLSDSEIYTISVHIYAAKDRANKGS